MMEISAWGAASSHNAGLCASCAASQRLALRGLCRPLASLERSLAARSVALFGGGGAWVCRRTIVRVAFADSLAAHRSASCHRGVDFCLGGLDRRARIDRSAPIK